MLETAIQIFNKYSGLFINGTLNTLLLAITGTVFGFIIGLINGIIKTTKPSKNPLKKVFQTLIKALISIYVEIFRATPMMVQAMVMYWGYAAFTGGQTLDLLFSGIVIISINTGAYISEIVRGGIISIDNGQFEGAYSIGLSHFQTMVKIILPQVIRNILPSISNEFIVNIKDSSVLNVIGVTELFFNASIVRQRTYMTFETYIIVCIIYFLLTFTITRILKFFEKKLQGDAHFELVEIQ